MQSRDPFDAARYQAILESSDDAIVGKTLDSIVTSWNAAAQHIFGYTAEEMLGQSVLRLFPSDRIEEENFIIERLRRGEKVHRLETVRVHKSGRPIHVSVTTSPIRNAQGDIVGASQIARDITRSQQMHANLLDREKRLTRVIDGSDQGYWDWNVQTNSLEVSSRWADMLGYAQEEIDTSHGRFQQYVHPEDFASVMEMANRHLRDELPKLEAEIRCRTKSGQWTWILTRGRVVEWDAQGRPLMLSGTHTDISQLKMHEAELNRVAYYDALTGTPNRRLFVDRLQQSILRADRYQKTLAVCYLDLDGFKEVNDHYGHKTGDDLLIGITGNLRHILRSEDSLSRLGGDEFVLLLYDIGTPEECALILDRILQAIKTPVTTDAATISVSASVGVSLYPQDRSDADTLLRHADQAMYRAKETGKNRFHLFDPDSDQKAQLHRKMVDCMHAAIAGDEFMLFYQPKVDLVSGAIIGLEALLRWQHPEQGLLSPAAFLPHVQGSTVDHPLGRWVISRALDQAAKWMQQGHAFKVSVNVGAHHLLHPDFLNDLRCALGRHPELAPDCLELEVLESITISDMEHTVKVLEECHRIGVKLALDDFGTGYSSLSHLRKLPVDILKIDQSFVRDMLTDAEDYGIVEAVIRLGNSFKRQVIAEGVETLAHGVALRQMGCQLAQGYGIAKPMRSEEVLGWAQQWRDQRAWEQR